MTSDRQYENTFDISSTWIVSRWHEQLELLLTSPCALSDVFPADCVVLALGSRMPCPLPAGAPNWFWFSMSSFAFGLASICSAREEFEFSSWSKTDYNEVFVNQGT